MESGAVSCVLTPEQTEGPYYIAGERFRRNITEGRPGTPLLLRLSVIDASTCKPIKGAVVDIWHCDGLGVYSGVGQGGGSRTFMRGQQRTDANGIATFRTVYPGWYRGGRFTSTSRSMSAAMSFTQGSSTSLTRSPMSSTGDRRTTGGRTGRPATPTTRSS